MPVVGFGKIRLALTAFVLLPGAVWAQDPDPETLADIRQQLEVLYVSIQSLKRELSTTGAPSTNGQSGGMQERVDSIERSLQRLTARTEELENRIERIVADGSLRINDLEWRLVELEGGDLSALEEGTTLGGDPNIVVEDSDPGHGPELAVGEQDDFELALQAYEEGNYESAIVRFEAFNETYPSGPLSAAAHLYRGLSLDGLGDTGQAARAYLTAFSANPDGAEAPAALFQLGLSLNALGQRSQACVTLSEVSVRYPGDPFVEKAEVARERIGCT